MLPAPEVNTSTEREPSCMTASAARSAPPLAVTMGEPAGIGGEILLEAWRRRRENDPALFALDDPERLRRLSADLGRPVPVAAIADPAEAAAAIRTALPVLPLGHALRARPGVPDPADAPAILASIARAVASPATGAPPPSSPTRSTRPTLYARRIPPPRPHRIPRRTRRRPPHRDDAGLARAARRPRHDPRRAAPRAGAADGRAARGDRAHRPRRPAPRLRHRRIPAWRWPASTRTPARAAAIGREEIDGRSRRRCARLRGGRHRC